MIEFKKEYKLISEIQEEDYAKLINDASNRAGIEFRDGKQLDKLHKLADKNGGKVLKKFLKENNYEINYYEEENNHLIKIKKNNSVLEFNVTDDYFNLNFKII